MTGGGPHERLYDSVSSFLGKETLPKMPKRWERFSDIAILPSGSFEGEDWDDLISPALWNAVAEGLDVERLGVMGEVTGKTRKSGTRMLRGEDDWVVRRENGVDYGYHVTKCMFSAGNVNERRRMGEIVERGEVVVDLFSGIGYYSLPIMVHSEVEHVHCCEWNDDAVKSLEWGLERNGISSGFTIHRGDNRESCMSIGRVADRVIMGLLPTSEDSFEAAMEVLSDSGGVVHVHGLARPGEYSEWGEVVLRKLCHFREGSRAKVIGVNRIKSYAPRWDHIVLDVSIN